MYVCVFGGGSGGGLYVIAHPRHPGRFILEGSDPWLHQIGDGVWIGYKNNPCNASEACECGNEHSDSVKCGEFLD